MRSGLLLLLRASLLLTMAHADGAPLYRGCPVYPPEAVAAQPPGRDGLRLPLRNPAVALTRLAKLRDLPTRGVDPTLDTALGEFRRGLFG